MIGLGALMLSAPALAQDAKPVAVNPTPIQQLLVQDFTALDNATNAVELAKLRIAQDINALLGQLNHDKEVVKGPTTDHSPLPQEKTP